MLIDIGPQQLSVSRAAMKRALGTRMRLRSRTIQWIAISEGYLHLLDKVQWNIPSYLLDGAGSFTRNEGDSDKVVAKVCLRL